MQCAPRTVQKTLQKTVARCTMSRTPGCETHSLHAHVDQLLWMDALRCFFTSCSCCACCRRWRQREAIVAADTGDAPPLSWRGPSTPSPWGALYGTHALDPSNLRKLKVSFLFVRHLHLVESAGILGMVNFLTVQTSSHAQPGNSVSPLYPSCKLQRNCAAEFASKSFLCPNVNQSCLLSLLWTHASQDVNIHRRVGCGSVYLSAFLQCRGTYEKAWQPSAHGVFSECMLSKESDHR